MVAKKTTTVPVLTQVLNDLSNRKYPKGTIYITGGGRIDIEASVIEFKQDFVVIRYLNTEVYVRINSIQAISVDKV